MKLTDCHNIDDFRALARRRLPWPVFDYIDGAADDEVTRRRNRAAFDDCDLIPRVLAGVESVDMRTTLFGREMAMPLFLSPTALQACSTGRASVVEKRRTATRRARPACRCSPPRSSATRWCARRWTSSR